MTEDEAAPVGAIFHYEQEPDDGGPFGAGQQHLRVSVVDAGAGPYLVIRTARWALDETEIDAFAELLRRALRGQTGMRDAGAPAEGGA